MSWSLPKFSDFKKNPVSNLVGNSLRGSKPSSQNKPSTSLQPGFKNNSSNSGGFSSETEKKKNEIKEKLKLLGRRLHSENDPTIEKTIKNLLQELKHLDNPSKIQEKQKTLESSHAKTPQVKTQVVELTAAHRMRMLQEVSKKTTKAPTLNSESLDKKNRPSLLAPKDLEKEKKRQERIQLGRAARGVTSTFKHSSYEEDQDNCYLPSDEEDDADDDFIVHDEDDSGVNWKAKLRRTTGYDPSRFIDESDDEVIESNYDEILNEDKRSGRIAKWEDRVELEKILQEENQKKRRRIF